jgi:hypothetical protein
MTSDEDDNHEKVELLEHALTINTTCGSQISRHQDKEEEGIRIPQHEQTHPPSSASEYSGCTRQSTNICLDEPESGDVEDKQATKRTMTS